MFIKKLVRSFLWRMDYGAANVHRRVFGEKPALLIFLFHSLFRDAKEAEQNLVRTSPDEAVTVEQFRAFTAYFIRAGYQFVSPDHVLKGLVPERKYAMITFDDGYANNRLALPVLKEFGAPAVFFVSVRNVADGRAFWWDVLFRERKRERASPKRIAAEHAAVMKKTHREAERYVADLFGREAFRPISDIDRPFTLDELRELSKNPLAHIGNHTVHHADLVRLPLAEAKREIQESQNALFRATGKLPEAIAYPYGSVGEEIAALAERLGLRLGFTVEKGKNYFPILQPMLLKRFVLYGKDIIKQCRRYRSDLWL